MFCLNYTQLNYSVNLVIHFHYQYGLIVWMNNSVNPDQLASDIDQH